MANITKANSSAGLLLFGLQGIGVLDCRRETPRYGRPAECAFAENTNS